MKKVTSNPFIFKFIPGPINENTLVKILSSSYYEKSGAQSVFIGRVRADEIEGNKVTCIEFSAYNDMAVTEANKVIYELREKYSLHSLIIYHSLGLVKVNQICVAIICTATRRNQAIIACQDALNMVKQRIPIWGLEITSQGYLQWKLNT